MLYYSSYAFLFCLSVLVRFAAQRYDFFQLFCNIRNNFTLLSLSLHRNLLNTIGMKPYDINLVADYIILRLNSDERINLINLKLQKLLYYLQAWSLGINEERFLNCYFEAWVHGPVSRELYDRFKPTHSLYSFITISDIKNENPESMIENSDIEFINFILDNYAGYSGAELESMTHKEIPWIEARDGCLPMQSCEKKISEETMQKYYGERWHKING